MATSVQELDRLLPLLEMTYEAERSKMAKIVSRINELRDQLHALDQQGKSPSDTMSAAVTAGADILWENWAQDRKTLINRELTFAFRDRENAKAEMVKALSKLEAARQVRARAQHAVRQTAARRSNW